MSKHMNIQQMFGHGQQLDNICQTILTGREKEYPKIFFYRNPEKQSPDKFDAQHFEAFP